MRDVLYVLSHGESWKLQFNNQVVGSLSSTQADAIKKAKAIVAGSPEGTCSQILIQGDRGQWRTEWTYGKDPFPPRG